MTTLGPQSRVVRLFSGSRVFPILRLYCQTMGWASGWESQILRKNLSCCKYLCPLTSFGWKSSFLIPHITSGYPALAARAPRPGPIGFLWRPQKEVRRSWEEDAIVLCFFIGATPSFSSHPFTPHGFSLLVQPLTPACWPLPRSP